MKKLIAVLISLTIMTAAYSCGKESEENISETTFSESSETVETKTESSDKEETETKSSDDKNIESTSSATTTSSKADTAETTVTSVSSGTASATESTTVTTKSVSSSNTNSANNSSSSNSSSSVNNGNTSSDNNSSGSSSENSNTDNGETREIPTEEATEPPTEENPYTAEIVLGSSPDISGENVTADGSKVIISAGGDYLFSGSVSDGQIYVNTNTEEKVKIILNGVDISNSSGPAILINNAKKCTIELSDGTVSYLSDGGNDSVNDGVIFSNDTLRIKGGGTLNITAGNAHGIASDDDVIIENGTYNITSIKSGIFAHDDITINGGTLEINGGTNGIKSKGTVNITGGYTVASGGTKEEKSSVYAATAFNYTGGYLFAAGNKATTPAVSSNPYIVVDCVETVGGGSSVSMVLNGTQMITFNPNNNFRVLMMLAPEISDGSSFGVEINGNYTDGFTVSGTQNVFSLK